ncbi:TPA: hypothetical protein OZE57_001708 [Staphylococcus aureus]|nr:hypothetical protein [Staphylococcus aureus]
MAWATSCDEMMGVIPELYLIENLMIKIIVIKAGLKNYEDHSIHSVTWLKTVLYKLYGKSKL